MCDTLIALPSATIDGSIIFGKNSDREPNEPLIMQRFSGGIRKRALLFSLLEKAE